MAEERKNVLEFIDETKDLPQKMTVESSKTSSYLFHLLIRFYSKKLGLKPTFVQYNEGAAVGIKSIVEEHSILDGSRLFVMSGCDQKYIDRMKPPGGTYVLAEATHGELVAEKYRYFHRKDILRTLLSVLSIRMSLRALLEGDWSAMTDYGDFESLLRKAKAAGWTELQTVQSLEATPKTALLSGIKRGRFSEIFLMIDQHGEKYVYNQIQDTVVQVLRYKCLKQMGHDDDRILKELDLGKWRLRELAEEAGALTLSELEALSKELVSVDRLVRDNAYLGINLFLLNSSVRLTR